MAAIENSHHYLRLRPVKTLSKLYLKIVTGFSPTVASLWVLWTPVYKMLECYASMCTWYDLIFENLLAMTTI